MTALILTGFVAFYSDAHDMAAIAARQGVTIPAWSWGIAHVDEDKLGWWGFLEVGGYEFPVTVVDYTHPRHQDMVRERGIIAEVGWDHAGLIPHLRSEGRVPGRLLLWPPEEAPGGRQWQ